MSYNKLTGLYAIVNIATGWKYVGSSTDLNRRWLDHQYYLNRKIHHNLLLQRAWNKNGPSSFKFQILTILQPEPYWDLLVAETKLIESSLREGKCYNLAKTATIGHRHTEETKKKIARALTGQKLTQERKDKIRKSLEGHKQSEETRARRSHTHKTSQTAIEARKKNGATISRSLRSSEKFAAYTELRRRTKEVAL